MNRKNNKIRLIGLVAGVLLVMFGSSFPALARSTESWPHLAARKVVGGLAEPVHVADAGDRSGRLFAVERSGKIKIIGNGVIQSTFLEITGRVRSSGGEEGLLSMAFPPGYGSGNDHFYVYYTDLDGNNQVSRFFLGDDENTADPQSEERVLLLEHPNYQNHNGGQLAFGPDGYLYIGTGDGGGGGDPDENAQAPGSLLGKILRIDVLAGTETYVIPPDNPFIGQTGYRAEIWSLGLRNPWRFSFDRQTGDLYIGDVGQSSWEEIDFQPASSPGGLNFGWNVLEGTHCYGADTCDSSGMTAPIYEYPTHEAGGCAVTGGHAYRGPAASLQGIYLFADYCSGRIRGLRNVAGGWQAADLLDTAHTISTFGEDGDGNLYFATLDSGEIYQITQAQSLFIPLVFGD